jgi:peptidoglycan/xylan/chitin deacetylase (PgdA/CDA1 family)
MDELHARLANGWTGGRFACFTFDDGYADNYTLALPVFRKHSAPFCVYMSPEALDRSMTYWWGQLEDLLQRHDSIEVPIPSAEVIGRHLADSVRACVRRGVLRLDTERGDAGGPDRYILKRLTIETLAQKRAAYNLLQCIWHKQDSSEHSFRDMLQTVFEKYDSLRQALQDRDFINYEQARSLAADPLVTIGAHGMTHQRLSGLDREAMELELQQSRQRLEDSLAVPVRHISYPYGGADACGSREFDAARDLGFLTGVTTRSGNVLELDKEGAFCLPRRNLGWTIQDVNICLCGSMSFL